ncbi:hypothetical protein OQA88_1266 [Cercophora sp. LCS_1]
MSKHLVRGEVILLFGPTGSGKSSFIQDVAGEQRRVDNGVIAHTAHCTVHNVELGNQTYTLVDTPGFGETPKENLQVLTKISEFLHEIREHKIRGAIYFHRITDGRFPGSAQTNLNIFKKICGKGFFPHVAFVTTMWDTIKEEKRKKYDGLNDQLEVKYMKLCEESPSIFKYNRTGGDPKDVLWPFGRLGRTRPLLLSNELERLGAKPGLKAVRKTTAGKEILEQNPNKGDRREGGGNCTIL